MMRRLICKQSWQSSWLILLIITALSAFLRLHRLDLIDIRYDEALAPLQALNITQVKPMQPQKRREYRDDEQNEPG